jgi:hypothetical protein
MVLGSLYARRSTSPRLAISSFIFNNLRRLFQYIKNLSPGIQNLSLEIAASGAFYMSKV